MISAAKVLAEFCSDHQFPFCLQPNCHRYLENMDDVHRVLRSLLANKIVRLFLVRVCREPSCRRPRLTRFHSFGCRWETTERQTPGG